ncbi:MAG: SnoaL-like domain-containing protein [Anaerolineaceae bacterium]|nr:SnoaL-like domain-containing protein [Anaerolineaceae bacterium]
MPVEKVEVEWVRDQVFLMADRFGFPIVMTQPSGVNGADLLPLSVIGCAAWDIVSIVSKQRQALAGLRVTAESVREDAAPWRFQKIHIVYRFSGHHLDPQKLAHAVQLTEEKYCSTYATLRRAVELSSELQIVEGEDGPHPGDRVAVMPAPSTPAPGVRLVEQFNEALNARDVDAMMALMTEDCVFENTSPAPDGVRYEGQEAVRAFWVDFFRTSRQPRIEIEEVLAAGDRCVMRWIYHWVDDQGHPGHVRGVDIYTIRAGRIAEKLSYVKG